MKNCKVSAMAIGMAMLFLLATSCQRGSYGCYYSDIESENLIEQQLELNFNDRCLEPEQDQI